MDETNKNEIDLNKLRRPLKPTGPVTELSPLRTYDEDLARAIREGKHSLASIAVKEQESKEHGDIEEQKVKNKSRAMIFGILVLIALGIGALFIAIVFSGTEDQPVPIKSNNDENSPISYEKVATVDITGLTQRETKARIKSKMNEESSLPGDMSRIFVVEKVIVTDPNSSAKSEKLSVLKITDILERANLGEPERLVRFLTDNYFIGSHTSFEGNGLLIFFTKHL